MITAKRARELVAYDRDTGLFVWRLARRKCTPGKRAGCVENRRGAVVLRLDGKLYFAHRIAWLWMTGDWPNNLIDHRDGDPSNNKWENLRDATPSENLANMRKPRKNTTGFKGVGKHQGRFRAVIGHQGKFVHIGTFERPEDAHEAYLDKAAALYGEFATSGIRE